MTAFVTAGEKGDGAEEATTGDCATALPVGTLETDPGVTRVLGEGFEFAVSGFSGTSNRMLTGFSSLFSFSAGSAEDLGST